MHPPALVVTPVSLRRKAKLIMNNLNKIILIVVLAVAFGALMGIGGNMWLFWSIAMIVAAAIGVLISWPISYLIPIRSVLVAVSGFVAFAAGIIFAIAARYSYTYLQMALLGITAAIFALAGLECFHYGFSPRDKTYRFFSRGLRGLFFDSVNLLLAVSLMLVTINYQRPSDPLCGGDLSGGFPLAFLCDNAGESPISDWWKISWTDILHPLDAYVDILFYAALLWIISFVVLRIFRQNSRGI